MTAFGPSPIRSPVINADGTVTTSWAKWFSTLYMFTGASGPANNDDIDRLDTLVTALDGRLDTAETNISTLQSDVSDLQAAVSGLSGSIAGYSEHDFGTSPVYDAQFTITNSNITPTSIVIVTPGGAATGRTADDWQFDGASIGVVAGTGSATCYVTFSPGPIVGKRKFNYTVI